MENQKMDRKRLAWGISLIVVTLIAISGIVVAWQQYDQKQTFIAQAIEDKNTREKAMKDSYDRIESNLARIGQFENMIRKNMTDAETNSTLAPEERIQNEIMMIEQLIKENNLLIANLNKQIDEKDSRLAGYGKTIKDLNARVSEW